MPIPFESRGWVEPFFERAYWTYKFAWLPHRCYRSEQWIWFDYAYRGTAVWYGPGEPAVETQWLTKMEFIRASLA
jgi:hypothetical protein